MIWVAPQKEIADREQAIADAALKLEQVSTTVTLSTFRSATARPRTSPIR